MANLKEVRQKIGKWVETNIGAGGDYVRAPESMNTVSPSSVNLAEANAPHHPIDVLEDLAAGDLEVPDLPSPPGPNDTLADFGKGLASDTAQSFVTGIVTGVLKHVIDTPTAPSETPKVPKKK